MVASYSYGSPFGSYPCVLNYGIIGSVKQLGL